MLYLIIALALITPATSYAAKANIPAKPAPTAEAKAAPAVKTQPQPAAKKKTSPRIDLDLTGMTSESTDRLIAKLNMSRTAGPIRWFLRSGYSTTITRTYTKPKGSINLELNENEIDTYTLSGQYRHNGKRNYKFMNLNVNTKKQTAGKSGYYIASTGIGKKLFGDLDGEIALAQIHKYGKNSEDIINPVYTLRLRSDLNDSLLLTGDSTFIEPFSDNQLESITISLTYKLNAAVSLRTTYDADNILPALPDKSGQDRSLSVSLVFSLGGK